MRSPHLQPLEYNHRQERSRSLATLEPLAQPPPASSDGRAPVLAGRYELLRTEETDASTASILAYDLRLKRWRSIRVARPGDDKAASRLIALAQRAAQLEHPNLERVIDVGRDGPLSFVVRDRFVGSLAQHLTKRGAVPAAWAVRVVTRCAEGLAWAHPRGIVHGHPRPEVVVFAEGGESILTRFGQRALLRDNEETRAGVDWAHLAPELRQYWEPDEATDQFALGALLYTMLAGHHSADLFYAEAYEGLLEPVPKPLRAIVVRACAFEPSERYPGVGELQTVLTRAMRSLPAEEGPPPWLDITQDFPVRGDVPDADGIIEELREILGGPPASARARPVDDRHTHSTIDPETADPGPAYVEPSAPPMGPPLGAELYELAASPVGGARRSRGGSEDSLPDYLVGVEQPAPEPSPRPALEGPPPPSLPGGFDPAPPWIEHSQSSAPAPVRSVVGRDLALPREELDDGWTIGETIVRGLATAAVLVVLVLGAGGVALYVTQQATSADASLVEAVLAEEAALSSWTTQDPRLEKLLHQFHDAPPELRASVASDFVREAVERADQAPGMVPTEVDLALRRLRREREAWALSQ